MTVRDFPCLRNAWVQLDMALVGSEPTGRGRRILTDTDCFALAESHHLVLNRPMGSRLLGSLKAGSRTARQMVLSFVFLLLWGLIAQSTAMIGFGLAGTAVAWILVKRSALREVSTLTPSPLFNRSQDGAPATGHEMDDEQHDGDHEQHPRNL